MQWQFISLVNLFAWKKKISDFLFGLKSKHSFFSYLFHLFFKRLNSRIPSLLLFAILLSSCAHLKHDGPPNFYVDETKIHDAVPKPEPLSKYGNMHSYRIGSHRYYVLKSSKNYDEVGTASWYGTLFHHHRTSSGERYNMLGMTAAHRFLPLPTYVRVTNLKNHREVIVKVNDRGPFHSNRLIDVSYVAAKKLGMIGHGTATVRVQAIDPVQYQQDILLAKQEAHAADTQDHLNMANHKKAPTLLATRNSQLADRDSHSQRNPIYIHSGQFKSRKAAEKYKLYLTKNNKLPATIIRSHHRYGVRLGPITDVATARDLKQKIQVMGLSIQA